MKKPQAPGSVRPAAQRRASGGRRASPWLLLASGIAGLAFAAPFGYLAIRNLAFGRPFWETLTSAATLGPLTRSLVLAATVSVAAAVLGGAAAWVVVRTDVPARKLWRALLPLPLVIPSFIAALALLAALGPGGLLAGPLQGLGFTRVERIQGFAPAFLLLSLITYPYVYLPVAARLAQLPPSLEEAARLLGRRPARVFLSVVFPQIRGAILAGGLLVFLYTVSEFGAVAMLHYDTLTRVIYAKRLLDPTASLALSLELGMLALGAGVLQREVHRGEGAEFRRSVRGLQVPLGRLKALGVTFVATLVGLALFGPMAVLTTWAVRGLVQGSSRASAIVTHLGDLRLPAVNAAALGALSAGLAVLMVAPLAFLTVRYASRVGRLANGVALGAFALPGLALALALVYWTIRAPGPIGRLYQTLPLLVFAYLVHFGALALGPARVAVRSVPRQMDEAARVLGASRARRLLRLELPLMAPGLLASGGLVLLSTMKELPATLLLAPAGFQTLATKIWVAAEESFWADAAVASLLLILLSGILTWLLVIRRSEVHG
ncbi:MAG: ABC transporter permease [Actinomycetota bacterium]